jgi:hypothetical protein
MYEAKTPLAAARGRGPEPGAGKTCVLRALRHVLPPQRYRLTHCHNATLGRRDFYRQLCHALALALSATAAAVFCAVSNHVEQLGRDHIHPVFLEDPRAPTGARSFSDVAAAGADDTSRRSC